MAKRPEEWDAETRVQFVRFDDPKSQTRGCLPERTYRDPRSPVRAPSRHRQDNNSLARAHDNELKNTVRNLCKRVSTDSVDRVSTDSVDPCRKEYENISRSQRQESYRLCRKECTKRDTTGCVAGDFLKEGYHDCAGGQQIGRKHTGGSLCNKRDNDSLGGHFFRKGEHIKLLQEELSRRPNNRNSLPLNSFGDERKAAIDSGGTPKSVSHSSSRSRSTAQGSNVDCPPLSHSRSVSSLSSRCITPRRLGRHQSSAISFREKAILHFASRLADPAPEEGFKGHARNRTIFSREYPPSKSKPAKSHGSHVPNTTAASSQRASNGIKVLGTRHITLIDRYQRGLLVQKLSIRNKDSSSSQKKTRRYDPLSEQARLASGAKECSVMCHEGYWRGKSEEGLSPLRSPWREVLETIPHEDLRGLHPCSEPSPADNFRRKHCRNPESFYPPDRRRASHQSPPRFIDSFRYSDPLNDHSLTPFNYSNNSQMTRASGNYCSLTTRDKNLSTNLSPAPKPGSANDDNVYVSRDPCSYDDSKTTEVSFTCSRCLAAEGLSSANDDDTHPAKSYSLEYENSQTTKDSCSSTRLPLAAKGSSSSNDPHHGRNFSWQNENPQARKDSHRGARLPFGAKDMASADDDTDTARISSWPNENSQTRKDSFRCARPRLAEDSLSAHNEAHFAKNLSWQKVNPRTAQDSFGTTRHQLGAKDLSSAEDDSHKSRKFFCQNELEESRDREAQLDNPHKARTSWRQNDLYQAKEVCHTFSARELFDNPDSTRDSWRRTHPADTEMEVSSSFKGSHREFWRPHLRRETASKFDETERDSWPQTGPHEAEKVAYPIVEPFFEKDSWRNSNSVAGRKLSTERESRTNICHDNTPPIRIPCCRSEDNAQPLPASSRHYCQPQSQSNETGVPLRVASRYPASVQRCETRHYDDDNFGSSSRAREKKRTNGICGP